MSRAPGGRDGPQGLALLDKPSGMTSFEALGAVKRALGTGRVGHTGTLDRFARGLMVVLTGRLTRLAPLLSGLDKSYRARVRFGEETDTLDPEGEVIAAAAVPSRTALEAALRPFEGEIEQVPPVFSAVHHQGERAYRLARRGERPQLRPRKVRVLALELLGFEPPVADLGVRCGSGTYVRALARDIALACGSRATVVELVRTEVGPFSLSEAVTPEAFAEADLLGPQRFLPRLGGIAAITVGEEAARRLAVGTLPPERQLGPWPAGPRLAALLGADGSLLAIVERAADGSRRLRAVFRPHEPGGDRTARQVD